MIVNLYEGESLRATRSVAVTVDDGFIEYELDLSQAEIGTVTSWDDIRIEIESDSDDVVSISGTISASANNTGSGYQTGNAWLYLWPVGSPSPNVNLENPEESAIGMHPFNPDGTMDVQYVGNAGLYNFFLINADDPLDIWLASGTVNMT